MMFYENLRTVKIRKRTVPEWMILVFFLMPFSLAFLTEFIGLPSFIRYVMDALVVCLGVLLLFKKQIIIPKRLKPLFWLVTAFFVYVLIGYFFNYQSIFYFIWGTRNTFRFYLAFLVFVSYVTQQEAEKWFKLLDVVFWINLAVLIYQFVVIRAHQDLLGGIFGVNASANGYMLIFFVMVVGRSLIKCFDGDGSYLYCALKCAASLLIAAMAEMKFYYIAFVLMVIIAAVITPRSTQKIGFLVLAFISVAAAAALLSFFYDEFADFFSIENLWKAATKENYSSNNDLNRLSAISTLLRNNITGGAQSVFGMGLGNCDTSDVAIFNSAFYQTFSFLHYQWFTFVMIFLETGFLGLALYWAFFVVCAVYSFKYFKKGTGNKLFCQLGILMSILCIITSLYNASLRIEAGYMAYFVLALPFMVNENKENEF